MATYTLYHIDAFTGEVFKGNPAAVCMLGNAWLPDGVLQQIANENNLSETAFVVHNSNGWHIRWFTPTVEVDLCGHATLAAAYAIFNFEGYAGKKIVFQSASGLLSVVATGNVYTLDFPCDTLARVAMNEALLACFDTKPKEIHKGKSDYVFVYEEDTQIVGLEPNLQAVASLDARGVIVTAPGKGVDFVSRFFAPQCGIDEDPVTGSAHTSLTPYWSAIFSKNELTAMQLSDRKGWLTCKLVTNRVEISGYAVLYSKGEIYV